MRARSKADQSGICAAIYHAVSNCKYRRRPYQMHQGELQLECAASRVRQSLPWPPIVRANATWSRSPSRAIHSFNHGFIHPTALWLVSHIITCDCNRLRARLGWSCPYCTLFHPYKTLPILTPPGRHPSHYSPPSTLCRFVINSLADSQPRQPANLDQHLSVAPRHMHCPELHGLAATLPYMPQGQDLL